ncbi:hypothetical protein JCM25156A_08620 [Komagataeibacter kakiaceti JCM 25156]|uniref:beta family protein n=1 Tax=Komagataeibacter kakiaceti TaxID=943261 RepID=UPI000A0697AD|nr:beta family protein [Komagataeibacter kakiaceti]
MSATHISILKANQNELEAIYHLDDRSSDKLSILFEIDPPSESVRSRKYMKESENPTITYLDRKIDEIADHWPQRPAMIDGFRWAPDARAENGEHVIPYIISRLTAAGNPVTPVIGYDRWESAEYRLALKNIPLCQINGWCLRLDITAIEDFSEPEFFQENIDSIIEELNIDPRQCCVILDFADLSAIADPVPDIVEKASGIIKHLQKTNFSYYTVCGCSLPSSVDKAVSKRDTSGLILRKEMLVYQMLRSEFPADLVKSGDYGVRGPTTTEHPNPNINGKIRYTTEIHFLVMRGHSIKLDDGKYVQMHALAENVVSSEHYLGADFSWGDRNLLSCSKKEKIKGKIKSGNAGTWIGFDTNHHLTFTIQEVEEFERKLKVRELTEV